GSLAPTHDDQLPPRKRFRDSYSSEASLEEDADVGLTGIGDDVGDHVEINHRDARDDTEEYEVDASAGDTVEVGIDPMTAPLVEEEIVELAGEDSLDSPGTRDGIVRSVEDTPIDLGNVVRDFYHHGTMTNTHSGMTHAAIEEMINQRVNDGNDNGNGNGNDNGNGNGNGNNGGDNGDG
ncbi:hypothetical protein Tco_0146879, partial [Tanacetum coccineum]